MSRIPSAHETTPKRKYRRPWLTRLAVGARNLARMLDLSLRSLRGMDAAGRIPKGIYLGARKVWYVREIRAWLKAGAPDRATWELLRDGPQEPAGRR
jgi:hypothetical protein